jgi:hypothetical protein
MSTENVSNEEKGNGVLTDVMAMLPIRKVCFFKLKKGKYLTENGIEITTEMLVKHPHQITETWSFIVLD